MSNENIKFPIIRGINGAVKWFKDKDPQSDITPYWIRTNILNGNIPHTMAGSSRYLVDVNDIIKFLSKNSTPDD